MPRRAVVLGARRARARSAFAVADRARHLADRAQGLEGSADRDARPSGSRRRRCAAAAGRLGRARRRQRRIPPRHVRADVRRMRQEALVFTARLGVAPDVIGPGYWVFTPARLADGSSSWSTAASCPTAAGPEIARRRPSRRRGRHRRRAALAGAAGTGSRRTTIRRQRSGSRAIRRRWPRAKGWGAVAPFYVEQEAPVPPGGLPQPGRARGRSAATTICNTRSPGSALRQCWPRVCVWACAARARRGSAS